MDYSTPRLYKLGHFSHKKFELLCCKHCGVCNCGSNHSHSGFFTYLYFPDLAFVSQCSISSVATLQNKMPSRLSFGLVKSLEMTETNDWNIVSSSVVCVCFSSTSFMYT